MTQRFVPGAPADTFSWGSAGCLQRFVPVGVSFWSAGWAVCGSVTLVLRAWWSSALRLACLFSVDYRCDSGLFVPALTWLTA